MRGVTERTTPNQGRATPAFCMTGASTLALIGGALGFALLLWLGIWAVL